MLLSKLLRLDVCDTHISVFLKRGYLQENCPGQFLTWSNPPMHFAQVGMKRLCTSVRKSAKKGSPLMPCG